MDTQHEARDRILLEHIENDPDVTQASLAALLGVAVGTVNWHIKRLVRKGYIKAKRAQRKKLRYIITPEGLSHRARLTVRYIEDSMRMYRRTRIRVKDLLTEVRLAGYDRVHIEGNDEIAEICLLTCLEQGISVDGLESSPVLNVRGWSVYLNIDDNDDKNPNLISR